jgi:hypothetical protein
MKQDNIILGLGALALFTLLSRKTTSAPVVTNGKFPNPSGRSRGLRNNNPGNIKETATNWQGQIKPSADPPFAQFSDPVWGARAMIILVKRTYRGYGLNTIRAIITRYAPPNENDTEAYISAVVGKTGLSANRVLSTEDDYKRVIQAMASVENGVPVNAALPDTLYFEAQNLI